MFERGKGFAPTEEGTPQGGVISPLLLNVALHGLETAAGVRYITVGRHAGDIKPGSPVVIRYADDLVALCHSQRQAEQVKASLAEWLAPRGLVFNEDKTRIVHLSTGFDFLGFNVRRYGATLLIKPSTAAIQRIRERLRTEMRALRGSNAAAVLAALTPIIRGWAAYYRGVVSSRTFKSLDNYLWTLTYKWATRSHANKPNTWVCARYFGKFNKFRNDHWVFGDARQRRLPGQVLLDRHRPAHPGHRRGVSGRPRPGRVLGRSATTHQTPAGWLHAAPARQAERPLPPLRGRAALPPISHLSRPTSGNAGGCRSPGRR